VTAQVADISPSEKVRFKLNIPDSTASAGSGDIFFSISAPSSYEWVALGQGSGMANSNMFLVYTSSSGSNVTLSPRTASGYNTPSVNGDAEVTLLEGSGVTDGVMTANVKCANCNSWSGGTMDFTAGTGSWIYAYQSSGGPKNSDEQSVTIKQHDNQATFKWDFADAKGGSSVNPFLAATPSGTGTAASSCIPRPASATGSASGGSTAAATPTPTSDASDDDNNPWDGRPSSWPTARPTNGRPPAKRQDQLPYCDEVSNGGDSSNSNSNNGFMPVGGSGGGGRRKTMLIAHGVLASLAFVILFPAGAIAIRLASFPGVVWLHAAFQVLAYLVYIAGFVLGVYLATDMDLLDHYHPIIGIVVLILVFFQPLTGWLHHNLFKKYSHRTMWSYAHIWLGRIAVTLGIINGGLGLKLADSMIMSSQGGIIVYGVIAGLVWLAWVAAMVVGEVRRKRASANGATKLSGTDVTPPNGHYAPKGQ
ncbi:iron reductase domain protein, partial [Plenodomus tracheiphilus IPT5]